MNLRKFRTSSMIVLGLMTALVVGGCSDGYDSPNTAENAAVQGAATNVLVEPATVKAWMDQGLVNNQNGFDENVVILDFGSDPEKAPLRIFGACRVSGGELTTTRFEGVGDATPMVATGEQMDAVLQRLGIDENTTIVFTSSGSGYYPTRAYWTFRYWGFPKERLKLLNGGNTAFAAAYESLMTEEAPSPEPSTYSVRDLPALNDDLRASIGEMVMLIDSLPEDEENLVLDARGKDPVVGASGYFGTSATPGKLGGDFVVVDGHPVGGNYLNQGDLFEDGKFKSAEEIEALFRDKGWTPGKKVTVYCTTGYSATPLFFAVDAILGGDAQLYDGSWSQLGKYSDYTAAGGELPPGSPWAIDSYLDPNTVRYNFRYLGTTDSGYKIETLQLDKEAEAKPPFSATRNSANDSDVVTNQVEDADAAYVGSGDPVQFSSIVATDATNGVLIDKATLQEWMDADLVNAAQGSNRVVILDVTDPVNYQKGHIPGAQLWDISEHAETRVEGPAPAVNMVVTGDKMDELIQSHGIDEYTTIVITSSQTQTFYPSRAYFLLRYYGFPKDNLKVLNGYNAAWGDSEELVSTPTTLERSDLSVKDIANHRPDLRVSLPELMDALEDNRGVPVDFRGVKTAAASTAGVFGDVTGDYVVFEGQLKGGKGYVWKDFNVNHDGKDIDKDGEADPVDLSFKDSNTIKNALNGIGLDGTQLVYSYCRTGYIASTGFFVLDGILGWPVMAYDGSWSQFGKMSSNKDMGGELPEGSKWATDSTTTYMDVITYNKAATRDQVIEPLDPDADALALHPEDTNQIEDEDTTYQEQASGNEESGGGAPAPTQPGPSIGC